MTEMTDELALGRIALALQPEHAKRAESALRHIARRLRAAPQPPAEAQPDWEVAPPGATHYQPQQGAYYKRASASEWYVWSRNEDRELMRWLPSPGTSDNAEWVVPPAEAQGGGEVDYTDIANRAQEITGRSIWPSTVKAVLEVAGRPDPPSEPVVWQDDWMSVPDLDAHLGTLAEQYEWGGDEAVTINDRERLLLIDFSHGIMADEMFVAMMKAHHDPNARGRPDITPPSAPVGVEGTTRLNEPFGNPEQLREAVAGFLSVSFPPEFDGCPDEVKQAYRYWHRLLVRFAGAMEFQDAIDAAALAQQPAAVDEAMVERAAEAYLQEAKRQGFQPSEEWARSQQAKDWMRAALTAALAAQQGGEA